LKISTSIFAVGAPRLARWACVAASLSLGGCALPPIYSVASYVGDGILYLASGKTSTDHGISALTGEDCATLRVFDGEGICHDRALLAQAEDAANVSGPDLGQPVVAAVPGPQATPARVFSEPVWQERVVGWFSPASTKR
jgi:hypothetical protein